MKDEKFARLLWIIFGWSFGAHRLYVDARRLWGGALAFFLVFGASVGFVALAVTLEGKNGHTAATVLAVFLWVGGFIYWVVDGALLGPLVEHVNYNILYKEYGVRPREFAWDVTRHTGNLKDLTVAYLLWGLTGWWIAGHRFYLGHTSSGIGAIFLSFAAVVFTLTVAAYRDVNGIDTNWYILLGFMIALYLGVVVWWSIDGGFLSRTIQIYNTRVFVDHGLDPALAHEWAMSHKRIMGGRHLHVIEHATADGGQMAEFRARYYRKRAEEAALDAAQARRLLYATRINKKVPFTWRESVHKPVVTFVHDLNETLRHLFRGKGLKWRTRENELPMSKDDLHPLSWEQLDAQIDTVRAVRTANAPHKGHTPSRAPPPPPPPPPILFRPVLPAGVVDPRKIPTPTITPTGSTTIELLPPTATQPPPADQFAVVGVPPPTTTPTPTLPQTNDDITQLLNVFAQRAKGVGARRITRNRLDQGSS